MVKRVYGFIAGFVVWLVLFYSIFKWFPDVSYKDYSWIFFWSIVTSAISVQVEEFLTVKRD